MNKNRFVSTKIPIIKIRKIGKVERCITSEAIFHDEDEEVVYLDICEKRCQLYDKDTMSCSYEIHKCEVNTNKIDKEFGITVCVQTLECQVCGKPIDIVTHTRHPWGPLPESWVKSGYECQACHTKYFWIGCEERDLGSQNFIGLFATRRSKINNNVNSQIQPQFNRFADIDIL